MNNIIYLILNDYDNSPCKITNISLLSRYTQSHNDTNSSISEDLEEDVGFLHSIK